MPMSNKSSNNIPGKAWERHFYPLQFSRTVVKKTGLIFAEKRFAILVRNLLRNLPRYLELGIQVIPESLRSLKRYGLRN